LEDARDDDTDDIASKEPDTDISEPLQNDEEPSVDTPAMSELKVKHVLFVCLLFFNLVVTLLSEEKTLCLKEVRPDVNCLISHSVRAVLNNFKTHIVYSIHIHVR